MLSKALSDDKSSLTEKLRAAAKDSFVAEVVFEEFISINPKEAPQLNLVAPQKVWCRRTHLQVDGVIWVEAETLIPESSLQHSKVSALQSLGNHSLGDVLFTDPTLTRSPFEVSEDSRSSVLTFYGQPILIKETFLPVALTYFAGLDKLMVPRAVLTPT